MTTNVTTTNAIKKEQIEILKKIEAMKAHFEKNDSNDQNLGRLEYVNNKLDELHRLALGDLDY